MSTDEKKESPKVTKNRIEVSESRDLVSRLLAVGERILEGLLGEVLLADV